MKRRVIRRFARDFYKLSIGEVEEKLRALPKWPADRTLSKVLDREEAIKRAASAPIKFLIAQGFVATVQDSDGRYRHVRIPDVMTGYDSTEDIQRVRTEHAIESIIEDSKVPRLDT